ncbi:nitroreductase family protein [Caldicellulosiruptor naganoensis]|uniref:Nitroreductase family protein n=1 Tax=Caldicellulosiruptor naganoensis TaxID=29324 RepID=A0ABY7BI41_9FIRM|nr:nitroreductase family protein [Caldicellulosiruptor naganoensis]WAM32508.1 nitroreductase family protein [Caldicellulosiruptor naganoensis]
MDVLEILKSRRSIRKYKKNMPLDRETIEKIIDAARFAPTARGNQGWEFVVVTDDELKKQIAQKARYGRFIEDASCCVAVLYEKGFEYILEDMSAASTYILIAAKALGLGSCWVASYKKEHSEEVKRLLNVPDHLELCALISIGYPDEEPVRNKKELSSILHWNQYKR